ncbi:MAG TPA: hypothetical protein PK431_00410 [Chitinophagales bacterium]|nr:hypothetical protein [Chitinophagales bacterium]
MSSRFKIIASLIATCILLTIAYAIYVYFKPVKNIAKQQTDIQLTDKQLIDDFNTNPTTADSIYKNKIVEITGTFTKSEIKDSICNVIFDNGGNYIVIASGLYAQKKEIALLKTGNKLTIKGIYNGFVMNDEMFMIPAEIKIDKCTILK